MEVYYDVPTYPSRFINISNVVDASYYGNPLTRLKRRKIINDSIMYKRGKSKAQDYRTIMIENIPLTSSLFEIMPAILGDRIISRQMLQTKVLTGSLTARIIFREQKYALEFINSARCKPLSFKGTTACVYLVATPTWPQFPAIDSMGFTRSYSRCLIIRKAPLNLTEHALRFWLEAEDSTTLLDPPTIERWDTEIFIWFSSEAAARRGFDILSQNYRFKNLEIGFRGKEHATDITVARNFLGIRSARKRNNRQTPTYDKDKRSRSRSTKKSGLSHTLHLLVYSMC